MNMATRREWLIGQGLAVPGRGKFSKKAHEALDRARLDGVVFDDETPATVEPSPAPTPVGMSGTEALDRIKALPSPLSV
jgi:CheY-like chemotaxis protein